MADTINAHVGGRRAVLPKRVAPSPVLLIALVVVGLLVASCGPEASRPRGGGAGADIGNRHLGAPTLEIHGTTVPSFETPLRGQAIEQIQEQEGPILGQSEQTSQ